MVKKRNPTKVEKKEMSVSIDTLKEFDDTRTKPGAIVEARYNKPLLRKEL